MPNNLLNGTIILYNQLGIVEYECTINSDSIRIETDCKNAVLESMEKMIDGNRTQDDFKQLGNEFLLNYPDANLEDYFEYFGFDIYNPKEKGYTYIVNCMRTGNPTVIDKNIGNGGHEITITRIVQRNHGGKIIVWVADPIYGKYRIEWNKLMNPNFNRGAYIFNLRTL